MTAKDFYCRLHPPPSSRLEQLVLLEIRLHLVLRIGFRHQARRDVLGLLYPQFVPNVVLLQFRAQRLQTGFVGGLSYSHS